MPPIYIALILLAAWGLVGFFCYMHYCDHGGFDTDQPFSQEILNIIGFGPLVWLLLILVWLKELFFD